VDRPLWQLLLVITLAGVAVQRLAIALVLGGEDAAGAAQAGLWMETAALLGAALGTWIGGRAALAGAAALGLGLAGSALAVGLAGGAAAAPAAASRLLIALLAAGGLAFVVRNELLGRPGDGAPRG
jgi:hypothetical protein